MSSRRVLELVPVAREDLTEILHHTAAKWGDRQARVYDAKVHDAFETIRQNPAIGHTSDELPETHRLYLIGSHVIVYRPREEVISVIRILHQRMSLRRHV